MNTRPDWKFANTGAGPERGRKTGILLLTGAWFAVLNLLVAAAAPLGRMYMDYPTMPSFTVFACCVLLGVLLAAESILLMLIIAIRRIPGMWKRSLVMLVFGIMPLTCIVFILGPDRIRSPAIHDITTDTEDPPVFSEVKKLRSRDDNPLDYGGEPVAELQQRAYPGIKPIVEGMSREEALSRVVQVVLGLNWKLINADFNTGIVEASDTTKVFGFTDDIVIRVRDAGSGSVIDIRSVSRVGMGDAGANAARIREFIAAF